MSIRIMPVIGNDANESDMRAIVERSSIEDQ